VSILQAIGWRAEALGWDGYQGLMRTLSVERASDIGAAIGGRLGPRLGPHRIARRNMELVFPHATPREIDALLVAMWDNIGRLLGEFPNLHRMDLKATGDTIRLEGRDVIDDLVRKGDPVVFVGGHFANWEVLAGVLANAVPGCRMTYRHANNPLIDRRIVSQRSAYGVEIFAPKGEAGAKEALKALQTGHSVALMNDQKMNDGIEAPFFGLPAMTASGPARMALKYDAPLVPMSVVRRHGANFTVKVYEPLPRPTAADRTDAILEMVTGINRFIEARILETPAQWFWVHRRFAKDVYRKVPG
jgi:KDO2-lipid IV(A) lauroyltransferase